MLKDLLCESEVLEPFKGFRNAMLLGTRIRLIDGIVKALLFNKGSWVAAAKQVIDITFEHGFSLGSQVFLHKNILLLLRKLQGREEHWHSAIGGLIGGALVWGRQTRFNEMLNLYVFARVIVAFGKSQEVPTVLTNHGFRIWAAFTWAMVMFQFRAKRPIQPTLASTMRYLHDDSTLTGSDSWLKNLGPGGQYFPYVSALVVFLKLTRFFDPSSSVLGSFLFTPSTDDGPKRMSLHHILRVPSAINASFSENLFAATGGDTACMGDDDM